MMWKIRTEHDCQWVLWVLMVMVALSKKGGPGQLLLLLLLLIPQAFHNLGLYAAP